MAMRLCTASNTTSCDLISTYIDGPLWLSQQLSYWQLARTFTTEPGSFKSNLGKVWRRFFLCLLGQNHLLHSVIQVSWWSIDAVQVTKAMRASFGRPETSKSQWKVGRTSKFPLYGQVWNFVKREQLWVLSNSNVLTMYKPIFYIPKNLRRKLFESNWSGNLKLGSWRTVKVGRRNHAVLKKSVSSTLRITWDP